MRRIRLEMADGEHTQWFGFNTNNFKTIFDSYNTEFIGYEASFGPHADEKKIILDYISSSQDNK